MGFPALIAVRFVDGTPRLCYSCCNKTHQRRDARSPWLGDGFAHAAVHRLRAERENTSSDTHPAQAVDPKRYGNRVRERGDDDVCGSGRVCRPIRREGIGRRRGSCANDCGKHPVNRRSGA